MGGCQTPALPFGWGSAPLPAHPSLQTSRISSVWPKIPLAGVLFSAWPMGTPQGECPPSPFPASPPGRGSSLAQAAESFNPIHFRASLSLCTAAFVGSEIPPPPRETQHALPTRLSFPICSKFCSWGAAAVILGLPHIDQSTHPTPPPPHRAPHCSARGIPRLRPGWGPCPSYQVEDEPSLVRRGQSWGQEQQCQEQAGGQRLGHGGFARASATGSAGAL